MQFQNFNEYIFYICVCAEETQINQSFQNHFSVSIISFLYFSENLHVDDLKRFICITTSLYRPALFLFLFFVINIVQCQNYVGAVELRPVFQHHCFYSLEVVRPAQQMLSSSPNPVCSKEAPLRNYISYRLNQQELRPHFPTNSC